MTQARPKPLVGALLGLLLGGVSMALLTVLGVLPPDRLPLFGIVALAVVVSAALLTQRVALARGRFVAVMVIGALLGGVALAGIPEIMRGGATSSSCLVTATSSLEPEAVAPSSTTAVDPFRVSTTDTVSWTTATDSAVTQADARLSLMVGGFAIPVRNSTFAEAPDSTEWNGELSVESQLEGIRDSSGMLMTGTYHFAATASTDGEECTGNAYIRIEPTGTFDGLLLVLLWVLLGLLLLTILVLAIGVRRSIRDSDAALAMVGTSAIPGGTSTTPPQTSRRESAPRSADVEGSGASRRDKSGGEPTDADRSARGGDKREGSAGSSAHEAQRSGDGGDGRGAEAQDGAERSHNEPSTGDASTDAADGAPTEVEDEPLPQDANPAPDAELEEDGLARSPYAVADGPVEPADDGVDEEVPAADPPARVDGEPVRDAVPADDTPPLEEREQLAPPVADGTPADADEGRDGVTGDDSDPGLEPDEPRST